MPYYFVVFQAEGASRQCQALMKQLDDAKSAPETSPDEPHASDASVALIEEISALRGELIDMRAQLRCEQDAVKDSVEQAKLAAADAARAKLDLTVLAKQSESATTEYHRYALCVTDCCTGLCAHVNTST